MIVDYLHVFGIPVQSPACPGVIDHDTIRWNRIMI